MAGSKWSIKRPSVVIRPKTEPERALIEQRNASSRLLRLPAELRNRIYEYALPYRQDLRSSTCWNQRKVFFQILLIHASRQLRREALSNFCGSNLFEIRLHFGALHTTSIMNVLCLDPVAMNALRNLEVVSSYVCSHAHTMMPFFGCVSVFVDRTEHSTIRTGPDSWTNRMECDRNMKWGVVGEKCVRVKEEMTVVLLEEVQRAGLHEEGRLWSRAELEGVAARVHARRRKQSALMPRFGRAIKREAVMVSQTIERYRETPSFLG